ncbi:hypothetical protein [Piscinibacter gummiphilus]|uniref:hypothetical protein n=1 Tax=Piscinibacter gummiphilus TaxID=946333 RepID=UPI0012F49C1B|nr:hypothetical protein [Piscinibacter gummiphilus]
MYSALGAQEDRKFKLMATTPKKPSTTKPNNTFPNAVILERHSSTMTNAPKTSVAAVAAARQALTVT